MRLRRFRFPPAGYPLILVMVALSAFRPGSDVAAGPVRPQAEHFGYRVVHAYPHDPQAFTQGLVYLDSLLIEGTGLRGRSSLRRVELETGEVRQIRPLPPEIFGEGVTVIGRHIVQLSYLSGRGFVYDRDSFEPVAEFSYAGQGWGLTHDGERLIMSNGSDLLVFLDPETYEPRGQVRVHDDAGRLGRLNELEFIDGEVWANLLGEDRIARIDPRTGRVTGWIDLQGLGMQRVSGDPEKVLNGIAYDPVGGRIFVTGKLWDELYEIELVPAE